MRCTGYEMARYKGTQASHLYDKSMHTLCTIQWATAPGQSLNYPRSKSITHLRTFSDNGVYIALQLFLVILVSDQWRRVLIPYSYRQATWGLLHARGWLSRYTWDQRLYVVSEPRETHSPMLKARFLHLRILVAAGIEPPTSWLPGQRVTTQPRLSVGFCFIIIWFPITCSFYNNSCVHVLRTGRFSISCNFRYQAYFINREYHELCHHISSTCYMSVLYTKLL